MFRWRCKPSSEGGSQAQRSQECGNNVWLQLSNTQALSIVSSTTPLCSVIFTLSGPFIPLQPLSCCLTVRLCHSLASFTASGTMLSPTSAHKKYPSALAGVAHSVGCSSPKQKVASGNQSVFPSHIDASLSLSPSLPLSVNQSIFFFFLSMVHQASSGLPFSHKGKRSP